MVFDWLGTVYAMTTLNRTLSLLVSISLRAVMDRLLTQKRCLVHTIE